MIIDINDFETITTELLFEGKLFKSLSGIVYKFQEVEYSTLTVSKTNTYIERFEIHNIDGSINCLIKVDNSGKIFDLVVNKVLWKSKINEGLINYAPYNTFISEKGEFKIKETGYGSMFYLNNVFVGRIRRETNLLTRQDKLFIDFITKEAVDFLIAVCSVEIIQNRFLKLSSLGE